MKIAMTETDLEAGHSPYPASQTVGTSVEVGDILTNDAQLSTLRDATVVRTIPSDRGQREVGAP
jgi:hypothetical protein